MKLTLSLLILFTTVWALALPSRNVKKRSYEAELYHALRADLPEKIRFEVLNMNVAANVPDDAHVGRISPHPPFGLIQFELEWEVFGREERVFANATVRAYAKVAVVKIPIKHNDAFTSENVGFEERELTPYVHSGYIMEPEVIKDLRANGFLRPGELLNASNTQAPFNVVTGEMLDIVHNQGAIQITARVRALSNGRIGDWIRVENPGSRKVLMAKVTGPGEVQTR